MLKHIGKIKDTGTGYVDIRVPIEKTWIFDKQEITECYVIFNDGRTITARQRKKAYAIIKDIALWSGYEPEEAKELLKYEMVVKTGCEYISLSDCTVSQAREYISFLVDFCLENDVPVSEPLFNNCEDIGRYLYACLIHRKCAICGAHADIHHVDRVGMGRNRKKIIHEGMEAIALCRHHHLEAHNNEAELFHKFRVYGIELDEYLCKKLKLKGVNEAE